jgi:hypothetical protein
MSRPDRAKLGLGPPCRSGLLFTRSTSYARYPNVIRLPHSTASDLRFVCISGLKGTSSLLRVNCVFLLPSVYPVVYPFIQRGQFAYLKPINNPTWPKLRLLQSPKSPFTGMW